ncbi:MAG: retroviral-like aspartic protease family protein [Bacteroidales bacterium]|jgi:clan AA aspartic protease (TIGR02281 family)|nr:retroviral-like aspartic protease family protein [Bacteroidales bacterium]
MNIQRKLTITSSMFLCFLLSGCGGCSSTSGDTSWAEGNDDYVEYTSPATTYNADVIEIPYTEMPGGTITIPVKINGMGLDMIFDTGASTTTITLAEAQYLYEKGSLTDNDILDFQQYQTADGSISEGLRIRLREVSIDKQIMLENVQAVVVEHQQAPLLLGQSVMERFREISVDRVQGVVKFYQ